MLIAVSEKIKHLIFMPTSRKLTEQLPHHHWEDQTTTCFSAVYKAFVLRQHATTFTIREWTLAAFALLYRVLLFCSLFKSKFWLHFANVETVVETGL